MKRPRPQDARRDLKKLWRHVAVYSCADGSLKIEPKWNGHYDTPGVITRMHSAYLVESVLAMKVKRIDWKRRTSTAAQERIPEEKP